ncbi:MAG: DNA polymerase III subunit gamma/tau [Heliobacteriaceae bacterium]|jgi:DNA polymerase-3 subunit gamma/tau|nr:DNA polymerase III subunit gamma/tau [Heliobacteriaceae bacterium]
MKYIPLYRKYRPQILEEIVGQEHIKKALANAISLDKISHAYLFTGPRGTGKTSTARILAKSLNCKNGPAVVPCGTCENCIDITNSTPMDVIEIDAASNRKVEDAQNILEKVMYAPINSRYKIYIIDEVHMLSTTAFNALLKTLEEPPKNVIFILATTEVHKVLDTIKSRCQRFDFKRITSDDIVKHLKSIAKKENINITDDALLAIAKNSAGGMRDSIALLDQLAVLGGENPVTTDDINNILGRLSFDVLSALSDKIISSNPQEAIEDLNNIYNSGNEPVQILSGLTDYFKNLLIAKTCRDELIYELTQTDAGHIKVLKEQAEKVEAHQIVSLIDKLAGYIKEVKSTNNPKLWLEVAVIDIANLAENTSLAGLQDRLAKLESSGVQQHVPPVYTAPAVQTPKTENVQLPSEKKENTPQNPSGLDALWAKLLDNVQSPPTRALLKQWATPLEISPENTVLTLKNEIYLKQFIEGSKKKMLEDAVDSLFGQTGSKVLVKLPDTVEAPEAPPPEPEQKEQDEPGEPEDIEGIKEQAASAKEIVPVTSDQTNMVLDLFDGKILDMHNC